MGERGRVVAVLHQAVAGPEWDGARKPPKPGGYQDSGADITWTLRQAGERVVTADSNLDPAVDGGWTFSDTAEGIAAARGAGATTVWANTVLFRDHPLSRVIGEVAIVGQAPELADRFDDKAVTNALLATHGLPVVAHALVSPAAGAARDGVLPLAGVDEASLAAAGMSLPVVVKPIRGRGSAGVTVADDLVALRATVAALAADGAFGTTLMVEPFLPGEEMTVTVLPPACGPRPGGIGAGAEGYWALPPVRRFNHQAGVAPYNGVVAVVRNSAALTPDERAAPGVRAAVAACCQAAALVGARAPIRIDCRQQAEGTYQLFDLNLKPNMTGPGRPGRDDQLSLSGIAADAAGMSYADLLRVMLAGAWR